MGIDYAYEMWVPRESLFDLFARVAQLDSVSELALLVWPDGKRLNIPMDSRWAGADLIPFDDSMGNKSICLAFGFEADQALRNYDLSHQEQWKQQGEADPRSCSCEDGRYGVGCIWTAPELMAERLDWLDDEPFLTRVSFTAATTSMSHLFVDSPSIRRFFVDLARESSAVSCALYKEGNGDEWFFLDGKEITASLDTDCHPRELRNFLGRGKSTESHRKLRLCGNLPRRPSHHEVMEVSLLTKDVDSGVRAHAYRALVKSEISVVLPILEAGLRDEDPRVRAVTTACVGNLYLPNTFARFPQAISPLLRALRDPHPEVRTVAAGVLRYFDDKRVFAAQLERVETTPATPENLGLLKQSLHGLWMNKAAWNAREVVEKRLQEVNFPFPNEAKRAVEILQKRPKRV